MQDLCVTTISQVSWLSEWVTLRCDCQSVAELCSGSRKEASRERDYFLACLSKTRVHLGFEM